MTQPSANHSFESYPCSPNYCIACDRHKDDPIHVVLLPGAALKVRDAARTIADRIIAQRKKRQSSSGGSGEAR
jgi:hypothetical protein